jgi:hypothetical protein
VRSTPVIYTTRLAKPFAAQQAQRQRKSGQKKARYGSGLNLSLEENRGDRFIMLHRKKQIQFRFVMSVMSVVNM